MPTRIHEPKISRDSRSDQIQCVEIRLGPECSLSLSPSPGGSALTLRAGDLSVHLTTEGQHSLYRRAVNLLRLRLPESRVAPDGR